MSAHRALVEKKILEKSLMKAEQNYTHNLPHLQMSTRFARRRNSSPYSLTKRSSTASTP